MRLNATEKPFYLAELIRQQYLFFTTFMNNNLQNLNYQKVSASATIITVFILFLSGLIYMIYYFLKRRTADA